MKILHFAIENFARVPGNLVRAERALGHESYLMTLFPTSHKFHEEDHCLRMPFVATHSISFLKTFFRSQHTLSNTRKSPNLGPPVWEPKNRFMGQLFDLRDQLWKSRIFKKLRTINIESFDVLFLDGGLGFLRNGKIVTRLKENGLKIGVLYCGSDLRTRGVLPSIENLADVRFTVEYDHVLLDPTLRFLYFPFKLPDFPDPIMKDIETIRIGHAPTNRKVKGTDQILSELNILERSHPIETVLIENLPHQRALSLKKSCDIFIDNIGELGYGINALESLAMGIPTAVQLLPDFEEFLVDHPFINISAGHIGEKLIPFIESELMRREYGEKGRIWVKERHDPINISRVMLKDII